MLTVAEAENRILKNAVPYPVVPRPLAESEGRILGEDVVADRDLPPFDRATMDGVAIASAAWQVGRREFAIEAVQQPGRPPLKLKTLSGCIEIMTGAVLPEGCDCVVPFEELKIESAVATIWGEARVAPYGNIHRRGVDRKRDDVVLQCGCRLLSPQVAICAAVGKVDVLVSEWPRIAILSTGDELVDPSEAVSPFQVRASNATAARAAFLRLGCREIKILKARDDPSELRETIQGVLPDNDLLILSGGVSAGKFDYAPAALKSAGVEQVFHRVSQRPGKPIWFGTKEQKAVFGLPGNPVSTLVCIHRYVIPFVLACAGGRQNPQILVDLQTDVQADDRLTRFLPVRIEHRDHSAAGAVLLPHHGSGDYAALGESDGFIELPPGKEFPSGSRVRFYDWKS